MTQQNIALVRRAVDDLWNRGDYSVLDEIAASDIVIHSSMPGGEIHGPEGIKQFYTALRAAFPDITFTIEDQICAGDKVVTRWTANATHQGEFHGVPSTGKHVSLTGIDIDRLADGRVVECWPIADELGLLQQLGVLPIPG